MAKYAVLASGNGGNFEALVRQMRDRHECVMLVYDRRKAFAAERAARLGVPALYVPYAARGIAEAEKEIAEALARAGAELIALAGFMRLLSPTFVVPRRGRILNIHPSLLPKWPGAHAIARAYEAGEQRFGATVHIVDEGMDTGTVLAQEAFDADPADALESIEARIHDVEHRIYPRVVSAILDALAVARRSA